MWLRIDVPRLDLHIEVRVHPWWTLLLVILAAAIWKIPAVQYWWLILWGCIHGSC